MSVLRYSADCLRSLDNSQKSQLHPDVLLHCANLGILKQNTFRKTKRGKRAGRNLRQKIPVIVSTERRSKSVPNKCESEPRPPCLKNISTKSENARKTVGKCRVASWNVGSARTSSHDIRDLIVDEKLDIFV